MDLPESITILAAFVYDNVFSIIALAVTLGIIAIKSDTEYSALSIIFRLHPAPMQDFVPCCRKLLGKANGAILPIKQKL